MPYLDKKEYIVKVFAIAFRDLVNLALSYVSLTSKETSVLQHRFANGETQEQTAESLDLSKNTVQNIEKSAVEKCYKVWHGIDWINKLKELS